MSGIMSAARSGRSVTCFRRRGCRRSSSLRGAYSHRSSARWTAELPTARPRIRCSASRGSTRPARRLARSLLERCVSLLEERAGRSRARAGTGSRTATYDNARLPHALIVGGAALGRRDDCGRRSRASGWLGDECGLAERHAAATGTPRTHSWRAGAGRRRRAAARRVRVRGGGARRVRRHRRHRARCPRARRAFEWFLGRNRLERPLYDFATGGCSDGLGDEASTKRRCRVDPRVPSRTSRSRRGGAAARRPCAGHARRRSMTDPRALPSACDANPILTAADWPEPVNVVFNPARRAGRRRDRPARPGRGPDRDFASDRRPLAKRGRRLAGGLVAVARPPTRRGDEQWGFEDARPSGWRSSIAS